MILEKEDKNMLAKYTEYSYILKGADKAILVFLDKRLSYNYEKDLLAIGAAIENMPLYIHANKMGGCWLVEILKRREGIAKILKIPANLQLEAVIALGRPLGVPKKGKRKKLKSLVIAKSKAKYQNM